MSSTTTIAAKTYAYAVVPSHGCYGSGSRVQTQYRTNDLAKAKAKAAKLTREYREAMVRYGGSSGGSRVVEWDSSDTTILGCDLDRYPSL